MTGKELKQIVNKINDEDEVSAIIVRVDDEQPLEQSTIFKVRIVMGDNESGQTVNFKYRSNKVFRKTELKQKPFLKQLMGLS